MGKFTFNFGGYGATHQIDKARLVAHIDRLLTERGEQILSHWREDHLFVNVWPKDEEVMREIRQGEEYHPINTAQALDIDSHSILSGVYLYGFYQSQPLSEDELLRGDWLDPYDTYDD